MTEDSASQGLFSLGFILIEPRFTADSLDGVYHYCQAGLKVTLAGEFLATFVQVEEAKVVLIHWRCFGANLPLHYGVRSDRAVREIAISTVPQVPIEKYSFLFVYKFEKQLWFV